MKNQTSILFLLFFVLLLVCTNCTRNEWIISDNRTPDFDPDKKYIVYFNPRIENRFSRSLTPFPSGCKAQIFAFNYDGSDESITSPVYESLTAGTLSPTGSPMILPVGSYNFFAVSTKNDTLPPTFTSNQATGLKNGIDYLWCGLQDQSVSANASVIDLTFTHSSSQLVFNIINCDTLSSIDTILYAGTVAPAPSDTSVWNLLTGKIAQLTADPSVILDASVNKLTMSYIFLPFETQRACPMQAAVVLNNGNLYLMEVSIPPLSGGYQSGYSYQYDIDYYQDTVILHQVVVAPWIENIEGNINVN